uniref:Uncharacterized protein n=1 Tax=Cairina moschata TaxID=8855 RepID=A0A8C3C5D1_CAIMO
MREHLARKHSIRDAPLKDEQGPEHEGHEAKRPRPTPPESGPHHGAPCPDARSEAILELVLEMIFRDLQPLSVVRDKGFGLLLGYLEPGFALPAPARLAGMLRHRYGAVRRQLERYLQTAQALVVCLEPWASRLGHGYLGVSASFIDGEWRRARCLLETRRARQDEAEGDLGEKLRAALAEFGLCSQAVLCVVHDGAQPVAAAHGWAGLCCAARVLQRCVEAGLEVEPVQEALSGARGIVRYFQQDAKAGGCLSSKLEALNKSQSKLVLDAGSCWVTTMEMCESLLELRWAVMAVLEEHPRGAAAAPQGLADHQWKLLQELVAVLRTLRIAASFLREEQNASASALMPCVHGVAAAIGQQAEEAGAAVGEAVGRIRAELTRRWGLEEEEKEKENPDSAFSIKDLELTTLNLFFAGTETVSSTLRYGFVLLMKHPGVLEKVHEEIDRVVGRDRAPTVEDRSRMPYTDAVIHEIQRVSDLIPMNVPHTVTRDTLFRGYLLPKGTDVYPLLSTALHDPSMFKHPHTFSPENFLDESGRFKKNDAFVPFSSGKRVCLGEALARMELFLFLTTILQNLRLQPLQPPEELPDTPLESGFANIPPIYQLCMLPR